MFSYEIKREVGMLEVYLTQMYFIELNEGKLSVKKHLGGLNVKGTQVLLQCLTKWFM